MTVDEALQGAALAERFANAPTLDAFISTAGEHAGLWRAVTARVRAAAIPSDVLALARAIPGPRNVLVLLEDWCGDAVNTVPVIDTLAAALPDVTLRVLSRDANDDLMRAHLSPRGGRAIPVAVIYDGAFNELGWWGSRPSALQAWIDGPEGSALPKAERYAKARRWYVQDRGASTMHEVVTLLLRSIAP